MMYALFKDGKQISKPHHAMLAVVVEAYELGLVINYSADFIGDKSGECLVDGCEIKEINDEGERRLIG